MNIIVCIDKSNGMMFNNRRQSQDREVAQKITELSADARLYMSSYSAQMFQDNQNVIVDDDFVSKAQDGDFCFVENIRIPDRNIEDIYIFNWNRDYPADKYFDFDLVAGGFKRIKKIDFAGNSHKKITLEIFRRP